MSLLPRSFFERDALSCARSLIGTTLVHDGCAGTVIETEAYRENGDPACHLFTRPSARAFAEEHEPGTAYIYLNYGIHWLANVLCRDSATGEAGLVLFRSLDPTEGLPTMEKRRGTNEKRNLCSGPGKLASALGIGPDQHARSLVLDSAFCLTRAETQGPKIVADKRVGISAAKDLQWRFLVHNHPGVSVPFGKVR